MMKSTKLALLKLSKKIELQAKFSVAFLSFVLMGFMANAQNRTVTGKVTDENGQALSSASVTIPGAATSVRTANDGTFSISIPTNVRTLIVSYVGYETTNVPVVNGLSNYDVKLSVSGQKGDEVVVVGYGTQRKKDATGNLASIKGAAFADKPTQSFDQSLGGRASGVQVTIPSGVLNAPPVIRVRGTNSISLTASPLIVIDGIPAFTGDFSGTSSAGNALASLNPNDIESIDIAKDAAATAIYGSRAANGVMFVTTKKGKSGRSRVTFDSWIGWQSPMRLPQLLNAKEYTDYKNEALVNAGTFNATTNAFALSVDANGKTIDTRWYDYVYRNALSHSSSISLSGGNEGTTYYFSGSYTDQEGIVQKNDFKRFSGLMNIEHKVNKAISVGGKLQYSNERNFAASSSGSLGDAFATAGLGRVALVTAPNVAPRNNDGSYNFAGALIGVQGNKVGQVGFNNPLIQTENNRNNSEFNHMIGDLHLQLKPIKDVTIRSVFGMDYILVDNDQFFHPLSGEGFASNGAVNAWFNINKRTVWTNTAQYDKSFKAKHNVNVLVGTEIQKTTVRGYGLARTTVNDPQFVDIQAGWGVNNPTGAAIGENYLTSQFSRAQYNYENKYFLGANLRRDGASQLGKNSKFGIFWGASAGWDLTKENFFASSKIGEVFSTLKLRGSYGKVGNIGGLGNFASLSTFGSGLYGGNATNVFSQAGNTSLQWETSKKTDIGFNWGILNDRISGEFAYFYNNINELLLFVPAAPSAGLPSSVPANVGTMYNKGVEVTVNALVIKKQNFSWNTSVNITNTKNEVTSLARGLDQIVASTGGLENPSITKPGFPVGMLFVTRSAGIDAATGRRIFLDKNGRQVFFQHVAPAGQFRFSYADGTQAPNISAADAVVYKNTNPKFSGGWENTIRFGNFDITALTTFQWGGYLYYGTNAGLRDQRFWNNDKIVLTRWTKTGDQTEVPKAIFGDNISNGSAFPLDVNVFKSDFFKLRSINISYNIPRNIIAKAKLSSARFYVAGNNLAVLTPYPGPDPEVSSNGAGGNINQGIDRNTVANARGITIGFNIGF